MSEENSEDIDNIIIYEEDKDCDTAEDIIEYDNSSDHGLSHFQSVPPDPKNKAIYIVLNRSDSLGVKVVSADHRTQVEDEEFEEIEQIEQIEYDDDPKTYMLPSNIEVLEDEEILQEHILGEEISTNEINIKDEILDQAEEFIEEDAPAPVVKKKKTSPPGKNQRYLLFDDLVATVVDYDEEQTPIVQFSVCNSPADENLPVECGICPDVMPKVKLPAHLKLHEEPGTGRYKCIYCSETYKDYKYLASHARRHMGIRPYVCELCKLYFSTRQDMRVHNQRRHQEKEHICELCGKTFSQNTMLKRHRESTHEKKRRFQCEHCPKAYYKNFSLQEHIKSVHMGQRRMLKCPFCGMQCLDAHKMARHRKLWHLNQSQYECEICQEKFTNVNYFDAHKRSIQCRNNTRRKQEEESRKAAQQQEETAAKVESGTEDIVWKLEEEAAPTENNATYSEFVLPTDGHLVGAEQIDEIFEQDNNSVLFEITLDSQISN